MLAEELVALYDTAREARPFTETHPGLTPAQGYEAAAALHRHRMARGWKPVGRKIGFTNRTIWPRYGVYEPIWGTVYDRTAAFAEHDRAAVPLDGLLNPRIEPEICFRLKSVPRGPAPEALLEAIDWVAHSIEIVQSRRVRAARRRLQAEADLGLDARVEQAVERNRASIARSEARGAVVDRAPDRLVNAVARPDGAVGEADLAPEGLPAQP